MILFVCPCALGKLLIRVSLVQVQSGEPSILDKKDIMPANGLTEPVAGIYLVQNQKCTSVDIF